MNNPVGIIALLAISHGIAYLLGRSRLKNEIDEGLLKLKERESVIDEDINAMPPGDLDNELRGPQN